MKTPQQVWEEAYPDRRRRDELEQETKEEWGRVVRIDQWREPFGCLEALGPQFVHRPSLEQHIAKIEAKTT